MILLLATAALADDRIYLHVFSHNENVIDLPAGADDLRMQTDILRDLGIEAEINVHRGEIQAAWWQQHEPDLLVRLRDPSVSLAYHPHPVRPFIDLVRGMANLSWDEAVAEFTRFETCHVAFESGEIDCSRPGGAKLASDLIGKRFESVCDGGPWAVSTWVWSRVFGVPTQLDTAVPGIDAVFGTESYLYWYMGQLVFKHPEHAQAAMWRREALGDILARLPTAGPHVVSFVASDKTRFFQGNEYANERWTLGATPEQLRPPPDLLTPPGKRDAWWENFRTMGKFLAKEAERSGGGVVTGPKMVAGVAPVIEHLTVEEIDAAAAAWLAGTTDRPPLGVQTGGRVLSSVDVYEALARALSTWRDSGAMPASVVVQGRMIGPIGDPVAARAVAGARAPVAARALLEAVPPIGERVPYSWPAPAGEDPILATEGLWLLAQVWKEVRTTGALPATLARPTVTLRLEPAGAPVLRLGRKAPAEGGPGAAPSEDAPRAPGGGARTVSRWEWYTQLQWWTAKPARFR